MITSHLRYAFLSTLLLSACAAPQTNAVDWNNMNYASVVCTSGSDGALPSACKNDPDEGINTVGKGKGK